MPVSENQLGKLVAVHAIAAEHVQRTVFIGVLSFVFFLAMMVMFYIRENLLYFLLASAFLIVYVVTLLSWIVQRRAVVKVYEKGLNYKKRTALWTEIEQVTATGETGQVIVRSQKPILLPKTLSDFDALIRSIRNHCSQ